MKISTKVRLYYLVFAMALLLLMLILGEIGFFLAVFVLAIGQFIIYGAVSSMQCPHCKEYQLKMDGEYANSFLGYQTAMLDLLAHGRCNSCKHKL